MQLPISQESLPSSATLQGTCYNHVIFSHWPHRCVHLPYQPPQSHAPHIVWRAATSNSVLMKREVISSTVLVLESKERRSGKSNTKQAKQISGNDGATLEGSKNPALLHLWSAWKSLSTTSWEAPTLPKEVKGLEHTTAFSPPFF